MRSLMVLGLVFLILALNCLSAEPVNISRENSILVLEKLTINQSVALENSTLNQTNQTSKPFAKAAGGLWGWGSTPLGYAIGKSGKLESLASQEWTPSI